MPGFFGTGGPSAKPVVQCASAAGVLNIDLARGEYFAVTLTENVTSVTFSNLPPAGFGASFLLWITQHASSAKTFAMPAAFDWDGGAVGDISTAVGAVDILAGSTRNGGSSWDITISKGRA